MLKKSNQSSVSRRLSVAALTLFLAAHQAVVLGAAISSFSPAAALPGNFVTIYGNGFYPGTLTVRFNGVLDPTATATAADGTVIQATVPSGATTGLISVSVNGGAPATTTTNFIVGPYIETFTPTIGGAGAHLTVYGLNFQSAPVTNLYFNGKPGVNGFISSETQITIDAPPGVTSGYISIRSPYGAYTNGTLFSVPPVVTGFSPTSGRAGTNVTVTGTNFTGATTVWFGSLATTTFTVLSNNALRVTVPSDATTSKIRVDNPAGSVTTTSNFLVSPLITNVSPTSGSTGTNVVITGINLLGATNVQFNGALGVATSVTSTQLNTVVPAAASSGYLSITTSNGTAVSPSIFYVPPSISNFTPNNAVPGSRITITGANFTNASAVYISGTPSAFTVTNNTTIGATVPAGILTGPISVTAPAGTATSSALFYGAPQISGFTPTHGPVGTNVVVTGVNFLGATAVRFNGLAGTGLLVLSNNAVQATVPSGALTGPISVVTPGGTNTSGSSFTVESYSDLGSGLLANPNPVIVGTGLVYTVQVANYGPNPALNVRVTNTLPASVTLLSAVPSQGTVDTSGNPITANLGTVNANSTAAITVTVTPNSVGSITTFVTVSSDSIDAIPANNATNIVVTVLPLPRLTIQSTPPNRLRLTWPVALTNFILQTAPVLGSNLWSNVTTTVTISNTDRVVVETNTAPSRYYRLHN